ncbi:MAG: acylphosphatase [Candidatus Aenigmarchaeota archaeon]|nr:acylphosphatase [Candidatus Aenigmarchaeota archaeon]
MKRARIVVSGLVHGVGYRSYVRNYAKEIGLKGFVKNLSTDRVEIVAEGYGNQFDTFLQMLRKGPLGSKVKDIRVDWEDPVGEFKDFAVQN